MIALVVDLLAAFRLTRLATKDDLTERWRNRAMRLAYEAAGRGEALRADGADEGDDGWLQAHEMQANPPKVAILLACPWCMSWWLALVVVAARRLAPRAWDPLARALAMSAAVGLIASNLDGE